MFFEKKARKNIVARLPCLTLGRPMPAHHWQRLAETRVQSELAGPPRDLETASTRRDAWASSVHLITIIASTLSSYQKVVLFRNFTTGKGYAY